MRTRRNSTVLPMHSAALATVPPGSRVCGPFTRWDEKASLLFGTQIVVRPLFDLQTVRCCFHDVDVLMEGAALASTKLLGSADSWTYQPGSRMFPAGTFEGGRLNQLPPTSHYD